MERFSSSSRYKGDWTRFDFLGSSLELETDVGDRDVCCDTVVYEDCGAGALEADLCVTGV